jgi:hypothetical protein
MFEHFGNKDQDIENLEFKKAKKKASDFIERSVSGKEKKDAPIDEGIKALILKLNLLPFLYTIGSCEGHTMDRDDVIKRYPDSPLENLRLPPKGLAKYFPGSFHIKIDRTSESMRFIEDLRNIIKNFPNASIEEELVSELGFLVYLDKNEKNGKYFPTDEARQYEAMGKNLIKDIERLVDDYLKRLNA